MPGHTAAHERASKTYNRSRNLGGQKVSGSTKRKTTTTKSNNNRTRIQDDKQKQFETTYQANEFSGTGKNVDTSKFRDKRLDRFYQGGEVTTPFISLKPFEKVLKKGSVKTRKFFADPENTNLLGTNKKISVLDAGKFKYKGKVLTRSDFESMSAAQQEATYKTYLSERSSGMIDAYGNPGSATRGGRDDAPPILQKKVVGGRTLVAEAPTSTEIAEKEEAEKYDARKTKKRGRRRTIFQQGTSKDFTLSKPILLGV
jgi:hypothetical protein